MDNERKDLFADINKGGWFIEGRYANGQWKSGVDIPVTRISFGGGPKGPPGTYTLHMLELETATQGTIVVGPPAGVVFCLDANAHAKPLLERITVKGPSDDGSGQLKAKLVLVNPGARRLNDSLPMDQVENPYDSAEIRHAARRSFENFLRRHGMANDDPQAQLLRDVWNVAVATTCSYFGHREGHNYDASELCTIR